MFYDRPDSRLQRSFGVSERRARPNQGGRVLLTVEVGGSSTQAIQFEHPTSGTIVPLNEHRTDPWLLAAPGLVEGNRIRGAHHLGWLDVHASSVLRMASPPLLSMNDAEAAALGEWWLRGQPQGTSLYIGLSTGIGAAAGPKRCGGCGQVGCLDAQIGGRALPTPLGPDAIETIVDLLSDAITVISQQDMVIDRVIVGGGMARLFKNIVVCLHTRIAPPVLASACPAPYKSAAPFGLLYAWHSP